jgi:hypothetical protein
VLLVGVFRQPFAARSIQQPLQCEIFFFQAGKRPLQLFGRGTRFIDLTLEVADTCLGRVELVLQRGGLIEDGWCLLRHQRIIADNRARF